LYPENGNHIVTTDSVTSLHFQPMYTVLKPVGAKAISATSGHESSIYCSSSLLDTFAVPGPNDVTQTSK